MTLRMVDIIPGAGMLILHKVLKVGNWLLLVNVFHLKYLS